MDLFINVALLLFGVTGSLVALAGQTWDSTAGGRRPRFTPQGWAAASCLLLTLLLGVWKEDRADEAAKLARQREDKVGETLTHTREQLAAANAELQASEARIRRDQQRTEELVKQTSLALLDLQTPTRYREYVNFRLGVMWYWIGFGDSAASHFTAEAKKHPGHIPSLYNLGVTYAASGRLDEASRTFSSIDASRCDPFWQKRLEAWRRKLAGSERSTATEGRLFEMWFPL